jgi:hypothetical protein
MWSGIGSAVGGLASGALPGGGVGAQFGKFGFKYGG